MRILALALASSFFAAASGPFKFPEEPNKSETITKVFNRVE